MKSKQIILYGRTYTVCEDGTVYGVTGKKLAQNRDKDGYLCFRGLNGRSIFVHRVVAQCFLTNPNGYKEVDHLDGNRANPSADNLEWVTHRENIRRAAARGSYSGERNSRAILNRYQVIYIRKAYLSGTSRKTLAKQFNVSKYTIDDVLSRKTWSHIA